MILKICLIFIITLKSCLASTTVTTINFNNIKCENNPQKYLDEYTSFDLEWDSSNFQPPEPCKIQFMGRGNVEADRYQVCVLMKGFYITDCNVTLVYKFEYGEKEYSCRTKPPKSCGEDGKYFAIELRSENGYETLSGNPSRFKLQITAVKSFNSQNIQNRRDTVEKNKSAIIGGVVAGLIFICLLFLSILVIVLIIKTKKPKPSMQEQQAERRKRNRILQERSRAEAYRYRHGMDEDSDSETGNSENKEEKVKYINVSESNLDIRTESNVNFNYGIDNLTFERGADDREEPDGRQEPDGISDHINFPYHEPRKDDRQIKDPVNAQQETEL